MPATRHSQVTTLGCDQSPDLMRCMKAPAEG